MKNKTRNIVLMGVLFGVFLLVLEFGFKIPKDTVRKLYWVFSVLILFGSIAFHIVSQAKFSKKLKHLATILEEEGPDRFIEENKKLLEKIRFGYNRAVTHINLSSGYCQKGDYELSEEALQSVNPKDLKGVGKGVSRIVYYNNYIYTYFKLRKDQEALDMLVSHDTEISKHENHPSLGGAITSLRIFEHLARNQISEAEELLNLSKEKWPTGRLTEDWDYLQDKIDKLKE